LYFYFDFIYICKESEYIMLSEYINAAMRKAKYEILEDKSFYGEIPGFKGLYANEQTLEKCRKALIETLEDWLIFSFSKNLPLPKISGIELKVRKVANA
jgi:predicted RNase H-like HicB family nuclease